MRLQVYVPFSGSQYSLDMSMIGIPTVGWAADESTTLSGPVTELVVTPAELLGLKSQIVSVYPVVHCALPPHPAHRLRLLLTSNPALIATASVKFQSRTFIRLAHIPSLSTAELAAGGSEQ